MTTSTRTRNSYQDLEDSNGTASTSVIPTPIPTSTVPTTALLTEDVNDVRHSAKRLVGVIGNFHQKVYQKEWAELTQERGAQSPLDMLGDLAEKGFAWRDISRLLGVSVPAVQKWRKGEKLSGENRGRLARLLAACDFIESHYYVEDVASWFEMRLIENVPVTPIDLWASGQHMIFFEYAIRHLSAEDALNKFDPDWRETYRTDFETFRAEDGKLAIRMRDR